MEMFKVLLVQYFSTFVPHVNCVPGTLFQHSSKLLWLKFLVTLFSSSEGWEQSGLFEFYKAKLKYIKDREEAEKLKVQEFPPSRSR